MTIMPLYLANFKLYPTSAVSEGMCILLINKGKVNLSGGRSYLGTSDHLSRSANHIGNYFYFLRRFCLASKCATSASGVIEGVRNCAVDGRAPVEPVCRNRLQTTLSCPG